MGAIDKHLNRALGFEITPEKIDELRRIFAAEWRAKAGAQYLPCGHFAAPGLPCPWCSTTTPPAINAPHGSTCDSRPNRSTGSNGSRYETEGATGTPGDAEVSPLTVPARGGRPPEYRGSPPPGRDRRSQASQGAG